jgi:D-alanyl-lipoteichoic acid acyltransferase DltB (MBOAT superfamily)
MLFNTVRFFGFLAVVLALFYASPRGLRKYLLLAASYFFYASWNPRFIPLLLTLTAIDYGAGIWLEGVRPGRKKAVLVMSIAANLGFLGFFKYANFLTANLGGLLGADPASLHLEVVLPLGISFHTFQSLSYVIDVYRGEQAAIRNPVDYALFICFFPQLVAGPIVRARNFFRDLLDWHPPTTADVARGLFLLALGLTKKMAFADSFAIVADRYFGAVLSNPGRATAWSGVFAFAMQIYFDFSGYTDMAIGMAKLLGFHFPANFRRPYLAASITEFWRRWHISLSSWLRDYLYVSLGGNRGGALRTYRNLMVTMLLGGLWHGASWNFVLWGGYHGALLSLERMLFGARRGTTPAEARSWWYPLQGVLTFGLVSIGWVFFRSPSLPESWLVLWQMFAGGPGRALFEPWHFGLLAVALLIALLEENLGWFERLMDSPPWVYATALAALFVCLELFGVVDREIPFIYFQF